MKNKNLLFSAGLLGLAFFIADRIFKNLFLIGKIYGVKNFGLVFAFSFSYGWLSILFYFLVVILIFLLIHFLILAIKNNNYWRLVAVSLLLAGATSNLIDRLKFGFVIDYLNFYFFYNNLADLAIWGGLFCWFWPWRQK